MSLWNNVKKQRLKEQCGLCAICGSSLQSFKGRKHTSDKTAALDHDHNTDQCRGVLCLQCNMGLGSFGDNPEMLDKAASYLRSWADKEGKTFGTGPQWSRRYQWDPLPTVAEVDEFIQRHS